MEIDYTIRARASKFGKLLILTGICLGLQACQTYPNRNYPMPQKTALREVFRGGEMKGMEDASGQQIGSPTNYDLVEHVCSSVPIFDSFGRYVRTSVKCW